MNASSNRSNTTSHSDTTRKPRSSRRSFLATAASTAAACHVVPRYVLGGAGHVAPSDRVNVALVGAGGRGLRNAAELLKLDDVRITAIADPAERWDLNKFYYKGFAGREPTKAAIERVYRRKEWKFECALYEDFREMLDREKSLDAVLCATPDHSHATVSLAAMRAGRHVYCEKPLTHNIAEARLVAKVARETGLATQMGNQGHSRDSIRVTCELIWAGAIGEVQAVHAWVPATRWNPSLSGKPTDNERLPAGLNWELWLGPRPHVGFHSAYAPVAWRDFWTFGCGALGDFGCHDLDAACWALDLDAPETVEMRPAGYMDADIAPHGEIGYFKFGRRGDRPPVEVTWYSGGLQPPRPDALPEGMSLPSRGVLFIGKDGVLLCGGAGGANRVFPEDAAFERPSPTIKRSAGHHRDWIDAIKGGDTPSSHFEYGARLTEITLLGLVALRTGKRIEWDAGAMRVKNVPEAEPMIQGEYRSGWELS